MRRIKFNICTKCGFNHDDPQSTIEAVQVLACVLTHSRYRYKVFTRYGEVKPMKIIPLDKKRKSKMRFQKIFRFTLGSRILAIKVNAWNQELHTHYGITNQVPNSDMVIPFWDFKENTPLPYILAALRRIQEDEYIGDIYVIQTYPLESYRAVCFDATTWPRYIKIIAGTEHIDWSYVKHSVMRGRAVIRITNKPGTENRMIRVLVSKNPPTMVRSIHHVAFFASLKIGIAPQFPMPKLIKVRLSKYESFR